MKNYTAPWGRVLIVSTTLTAIFCVGLTFAIPYLPHHQTTSFAELLRWLPAVLVPFCALFMIRGYSITDDAVLIHRVFWSDRIERRDIVAALANSDAMKGSTRICGNGGFFSFSGFYRSEQLGSFRAYVTDLQRTVVLKTEKKNYVLSPSEPEEFVKDLKPIRR